MTDNIEYSEEKNNKEFYRACYELYKVNKYLKIYLDVQYKALVTKTFFGQEEMTMQSAREIAKALKQIIPGVNKGARYYEKKIKPKTK